MATFTLTTYLSDVEVQIFDLYFIDETDLWHKLFSVTFKVEDEPKIEKSRLLYAEN